MTVKDSRVKKGSIKFTLVGPPAGTPLDVSCQATDIKLTPKQNAGNSQEVLCGDQVATGGTVDWTLDITSIQDFDDPAGFVLWCLTNNGKAATFEFYPNDVATTSGFTQTVVVAPIEIGGAVGVQNTSAVSWALAGPPTPLAPKPPAKA